MSFLTNLFVFGSYVIIAVALAMGLQAFAGAEAVVGWLAAAVFFLFAAQIHGTLNRVQENAALVREIRLLRRALGAAEQDLERVAGRLDDLDDRVMGVSDRRNRRLASEMKVLESLVQQLAGGVAERFGENQPDAAAATEDDAPNAAWRVGRFDTANPSAYDRANEDQLLTAVRESLEQNRVDLYLQPIVSLPQRRLRFYEALTRLRADSGEILMPRHYLRVAENANLVSAIDNLLLFRAVQTLRKLMESDREACIFCNISTRSLQDRAFFPQFLDYMENNTDLSGKLIFEFAQDTFDVCGPLELANLRRLTGLGFRFSMDQVGALDFDAATLRDRGFAFIKVPARVLLERQQTGETPIAEIKAGLARKGIDMIAEKVEDDRMVQAVVAAGVDFGQGYLLGEPRPANGSTGTSRAGEAA